MQTEDDITASVVVPPRLPGSELSREFVADCEQLLFQRPDDTTHHGYDRQAEWGISQPGTFLSNFESLLRQDAQALMDNAIEFSQFTAPMQGLICSFAALASPSPVWFVSSAYPHLIKGKPSKNPRYLQRHPDITKPGSTAEAKLAARLYHKLPMTQELRLPAGAVVTGRRNSAAEPGIPPLCAYSPLHYVELPKLFMKFISSMTGKSPSTTGADSERAMTKGPFNTLSSVIDLDTASLSFTLTGYDGWLSNAGVMGPHVRIDHDINLLVPEIFSRMSDAECCAVNPVEEGYLEHTEGYEADGKLILASRLGYRMTEEFAFKYFRRILLHPHVIFTPEMLRPRLQDPEMFAKSVCIISATHARVMRTYFDDGTVALVVPPVRTLLETMTTGHTQDGLTLDDAPFRELFNRDSVLTSGWYAEHISALREMELARLERSLGSTDTFTTNELHGPAIERLGLTTWRASMELRIEELNQVPDLLWGTIGRQVAWWL